MTFILEVIDSTGRTIHLTEERYKHILRHPDMQNKLIDLQDTLLHPLRITNHDDAIRYYYRFYKERMSRAKYLRVIVKYLNGTGYIITSYFAESLS